MTPAVVEKAHKTVVMVAKRWHVLEVLALAHRWTSFVEVGVFRGWTSLHMLKHCPGLRVTGVDPYMPGDGAQYGADMDATYRDVEQAFRGHGERARLLRTDSVTAAQGFRDGSTCAVFIDGDHSTEAVRRDVAAWLPKVAAGGWLLGHDWHHKSVKAGLRDFRPIILPDNVWALPR